MLSVGFGQHFLGGYDLCKYQIGLSVLSMGFGHRSVCTGI